MLATDERYLKARIAQLQDEADALCSEIRDLKKQLPWPQGHVCIDCAIAGANRATTTLTSDWRIWDDCRLPKDWGSKELGA